MLTMVISQMRGTDSRFDLFLPVLAALQPKRGALFVGVVGVAVATRGVRVSSRCYCTR